MTHTVTMRTVAERAGVSPALVSFACNFPMIDEVRYLGMDVHREFAQLAVVPRSLAEATRPSANLVMTGRVTGTASTADEPSGSFMDSMT